MLRPSKSYPARLAGVRSYQAAIGEAAVGDAVELLAEPDNPHDDRALAVVDRAGRTLGYLHRDSWLRGALIDEGRGARAAIGALGRGEAGIVTVEIVVTLTGDGPIGTRRFVPPS